jgi:RNA polymerase sigma-70 factor (ECF subfamily)
MSPAKALGQKELAAKIEEATTKLSPAHKEILVLREVEGLSYEELAEVLDIPKGTVMSRLFHARQNLKKHLEDYLEG